MIESQHEHDFGAFIADRPSFLTTHKAVAACTREFDRLTEGVTRGISALRGMVEETPTVRTSPGRCIVQLGPVALTVSWVRASVDTVSEGRLLIVEWAGTVARGAERVPERGLAPRSGAKPATLLREDVLMADATNEGDWRWRREAAPGAGYTSSELAAHCVDSLLATLRSQQQ